VQKLYAGENEGRVATLVGGEERRESEKRRLCASCLNIGLVEGSVRAVSGKEFSVSSKLSDHLCEGKRWEKLVRRQLKKIPMYVKREEVGGRL